MAELRHCGRTTRMVKHALDLHAAGKAVYILVAGQNHAAMLKREHGLPNSIKVETPEGFSNLDWRTMTLQGAWSNVVVLADHYCIENRFHVMLRMLHAYDPEPVPAFELHGPGAQRITRERGRQIDLEGWSANNDDQYVNGELVTSAMAYLTPPEKRGCMDVEDPAHWPWDVDWWKPSPGDRVKELTKAGALIAAEIDRLERLEARGKEGK